MGLESVRMKVDQARDEIVAFQIHGTGRGASSAADIRDLSLPNFHRAIHEPGSSDNLSVGEDQYSSLVRPYCKYMTRVQQIRIRIGHRIETSFERARSAVLFEGCS